MGLIHSVLQLKAIYLNVRAKPLSKNWTLSFAWNWMASQYSLVKIGLFYV